MRNITVDTPFKLCSECKLFSISEGTKLYSNDEVYFTGYECTNQSICKNFAKMTKYEE